jgi:hypothetical protein
MRADRLAIVLTLVNLVVLGVVLSRRGVTTTSDPGSVLRARSLEIVDEQGRVRAQLAVLPPTTMPDGARYAESVLLRLIDPNGRPAVKIGASEDGTGMSLAGDSEKRAWSGVQILADGTESVVKLTSKDGRVRVLEP